jgi:hypothetical protein
MRRYGTQFTQMRAIAPIRVRWRTDPFIMTSRAPHRTM